MSRYTREHYEDVARLLHAAREKFSGTGGTGEALGAIRTLAHDFANLFAADNPPTCSKCGVLCATQQAVNYCADDAFAGRNHVWDGGFSRTDFLAACGLEPARPYSTSMFRPVGEPGTGRTTGA